MFVLGTPPSVTEYGP